MEIRLYADSDEQAVAALWNEVLPPNAPHNDPVTSIRMKLAVDRGLFFVATVDGAVVGTAMGGYDGHRGWIYSVAVKQQCRRRGVGGSLLRRIEEALVQRLPQGQSSGPKHNREVIGFYEKLGFPSKTWSAWANAFIDQIIFIFCVLNLLISGGKARLKPERQPLRGRRRSPPERRHLPRRPLRFVAVGFQAGHSDAGQAARAPRA